MVDMSDYENDGIGFDVWTYVARLGCHLRSSADPFFADGDAVCQMRTCQYLTQEDDEELLHIDYEEFCCQVPGCKVTFNQLIDSEFHYASKHTFACCVCHKSLPSSHLLGLHVAELHDSFFEVLSKKKPSYECLLETCANSGTKFWTPEERKRHCIEIHKFSTKFKFGDYKKLTEADGKGTHTKKSSKPKATPSKVKSKYPAQSIPSQNQRPNKNTNGLRAIEKVEKMKVDEPVLSVTEETTESKKNRNVDQAKRTIGSLSEAKQISNSNYGCDKTSIRPTYLTQKSDEPSSNRRFSTTTYNKQISLDENGKNESPSAIKRPPISLAKMGERLSTNSSATASKNRHSVCFGAELQTSAAVRDNLSPQRKSLSPKSPRAINRNLYNQEMHNRSVNSASSTECNRNTIIGSSIDKVIDSSMSPEKMRKSSSRSNIPVFIGRSSSISHTPESPKYNRSRHSVDHMRMDIVNSPKTEQSFRSRRSFPRNSFSSATSNSSCVSVTNDSQDQYLKGQFKANYKTPTSPSHKATYYQQFEANKSRKVSDPRPDNQYVSDNQSNNNIECKDSSTVQAVPLSPTTRSRIPVLRSSSCRSVHSSSSPMHVHTSKTAVPRNISFGHGATRAFPVSSPSKTKNGQHWYQVLDSKANSGNTKNRRSSNNYNDSNMDTNSVIEKCNFEDMRMALD